jgi:uncharacterized surface anchored protein
VTGEEEIEGAHITVVDKDTGDTVDEFVSEKQPHAINGLEEGHTYILTETIAPDGYVLSASSVEFTVTNEKVNQTVEMKDKVVTFSKTDVTGTTEIPGAHITVTDENGDIVDDFISGDKPHAITGLEEGKTYTLTEIATPDGYAKAESITFTVSEEKVDEHVVMKDKQVEISKTDIVTGKELPGAELTVTDKETGDIVDKWVTTKDTHFVSGLEEGRTYILTEVTAPNGYEKAESIEFTVTNEKVNQKVEMKDAPYTKIQVNKVDSATKKAIKSKDFEFTMYSDEKCTQAITTVHANTKDGTATFENVGFGTYYIKETAAPLGYLLSDEVKKIVVDENLEGVGGIHSFIYENTLKAVVVKKTGDNTTPLYAAGAVGIAGAVALASIYRRRKHEDAE